MYFSSGSLKLGSSVMGSSLNVHTSSLFGVVMLHMCACIMCCLFCFVSRWACGMYCYMCFSVKGVILMDTPSRSALSEVVSVFVFFMSCVSAVCMFYRRY